MMQEDQGRDLFGRTAAHNAVVDGDVAGLMAMLKRGADPDAVDKAGWTPLHFAAQAQDALAAEALLSAGADPDQENSHGLSPRGLADKIANYDVALAIRA